MKILIATDYYLPHVGGIPSHIHTISKAFLEMGDEVCIIAPSDGIKDEIYKNGKFSLYGLASLPTIAFPDLRLVPPVRALKISRIIKAFKPDVVHAHFGMGIGGTTSKIAKKRGIAVVSTNHFMMENFFDSFPNPKLLKKLFGGVVWKVSTAHLNNADIVTTPTVTAAKYLKQRFTENEITPISNGINFARYHSWKVKTNILQKYRIPKEHKVLLFVGRLVKEKRIDVLIHSIPAIVKKMPATLIIVGRGNWTVNYKKMADNLGVSKNIIFADYVSDKKLQDLYKLSDVFVMPSIAELQSIATLEAMASGLPVVAANKGALPELVFNGKNGYLFKPDDANSLSKNILKIFSKKGQAKKMGKKSVAIAKGHNISDVAIKFTSLYQKTIAINLMKKNVLKPVPFYLTRGFTIKIMLAILVIGVLIRNLLVAPTIAHAKGLSLKNRIMNLKIMTGIENLDQKFKTNHPLNKQSK